MMYLITLYSMVKRILYVPIFRNRALVIPYSDTYVESRNSYQNTIAFWLCQGMDCILLSVYLDTAVRKIADGNMKQVSILALFFHVNVCFSIPRELCSINNNEHHFLNLIHTTSRATIKTFSTRSLYLAYISYIWHIYSIS